MKAAKKDGREVGTAAKKMEGNQVSFSKIVTKHFPRSSSHGKSKKEEDKKKEEKKK